MTLFRVHKNEKNKRKGGKNYKGKGSKEEMNESKLQEDS